jgi:signal transduction histidine kinase
MNINKSNGKILKTQVFSSRIMDNLICDMLDLEILEINSFKFSSEYFDLGALIMEAFQMIAHKAEESNVRLVAEID